MIATNNSWITVFDNVSKISEAMSDALCRISTGAAFATRKLYTDDEEVIIDVARPIILNGIEDLALRPDLLERTIAVELPRMEPEKRLDETKLWADYDVAKPFILGALLDAVVASLSTSPQLPEGRTWPRMADFAQWVTAAEKTLGWEPGSFLDALDTNKRSASARALAAGEPLTSAVRDLAKDRTWTGTGTDLHRCLVSYEEPLRGMPATPNLLSGQLRRLAPALRDVGVAVTFFRQGHESTKFIEIKALKTTDRIDRTDRDGEA
jgi:putative DNA primase/helicase